MFWAAGVSFRLGGDGGGEMWGARPAVHAGLPKASGAGLGIRA